MEMEMTNRYRNLLNFIDIMGWDVHAVGDNSKDSCILYVKKGSDIFQICNRYYDIDIVTSESLISICCFNIVDKILTDEEIIEMIKSFKNSCKYKLDRYIEEIKLLETIINS